MSRHWQLARNSGVYDRPCPMCSHETPEELLCIHNDPLCPECCEEHHPHQCRDCNGARSFVVGHQANGYPIVATCDNCDGTGRVNERPDHD